MFSVPLTLYFAHTYNVVRSASALRIYELQIGCMSSHFEAIVKSSKTVSDFDKAAPDGLPLFQTASYFKIAILPFGIMILTFVYSYFPLPV